MPRQNTKLIRIPIEQGIFTSGSDWEIGIRLKRAANLAWKYRALDKTVAMGKVLTTPETIGPLGTASPILSTAVLAWGVVPFFDSTTLRYLVGGHDGTRLALWLGESGTKLTDTGTALTTGAGVGTPVLWSLVFWPTQGKLFASRPDANKMKQVLATSPFTMTDYSPSTMTTRASFLKLHGDRLFLVDNQSQAPRSLVYYTDVDDPATIRANNFYQVFDNVLWLGECAPSGLDFGARAQLTFGCQGSIVILDGTPGAGNDVLRVLTSDMGMVPETAAETPYGIIFVDTSNANIWLIPRGGEMPIEIGTPIRDKVNFGSGFWRQPYYYYFPNIDDGSLRGQTSSYYILDFSDPKNASWWGPHSPQSQGSLTLGGVGVTYPQLTLTSEVRFLSTTENRLRKIEPPVLRDVQVIETGFIAEEGHDVSCSRIVIETDPGATFNITLTWTRSDGTSFSRVIVVPTNALGVELASFPALEQTRGPFFKITLLSGSGVGVIQLDRIRNLWVEVRSSLRQH